MRLGIALALLTGLLALPGAAGSAKAPPARAVGAPRVETVTFSIRHRVFHDFHDMQTVRLNQDFILGDTDYSARVVQYVPDFYMDLTTRKVASKSEQPDNPAFKVIVRKGKAPQDTTWAFLNMPPHFGRRSYFAFHVIRIDFLGHAPMIADTVATPAQPETHAPASAPAAPDSLGRRDTLGR